MTALNMKDNMKQTWTTFWKDEDGLGTLEILLIIAVLIIIAIAFRKWIMKWMKDLFTAADTQISTETGSIRSEGDGLSPGTAKP